MTAVVALVLGVLTAAPASGSTPASVEAASLPASLSEAALGGPVKMADLSKFNPGNIISDAVFFNRGTMTEAQIQTFLDGKVRTCSSNFVCLKDWYDNTRSIPADAMCGAYQGGTRERASRIIYKVAQSCGINPQVLLVMLQKEQGLILSSAPSAWNYQAAMGQGCPDTAACDTRYYGFFNQVQGAAWQLKRYANPPGTTRIFTWYAPGNTWNVRYHPNAACGTSPVYIQNQATANLYYYTPYQPTGSALAAGYSASPDPCASYGNRNFFQFFTDWFGSTQRDAGAEILAEYNAQGGAASLGAATTGLVELTKNGGGFGTAYEFGSIYWSYAHGAKTVRMGPLRDYYFVRGGADGNMGWPALNQQTLALSTGNGIGQLFSAGSLYSGTAGTFIVRDPMRGGYFSLNGAAGPLGWPTADESCANGTCAQSFEGGTVVASSAGVFPVVSPVRALFEAAGGAAGTWGVPLSGVLSVAYNGGGLGQVFANGSAYYRSGGPAFFVSGAVRDAYFARGGAAGSLGFPTGAAVCEGSTGCRQQFDGGWLLWTAAAGARVGDPAIDAAHNASSGVLGTRTAGSFVRYAYNGGGFAEGFANGAVFYKPSVGAAFAVSGAVRDAYFATGGAAGRYGWPTSAMTCANGTCAQSFEGGTVVASSAGVFPVVSPVRALFEAAGGAAGTWGVPLSGVLSVAYNGGGLGQVFANGSAYYRSGGPAFFVSGAVRDAYFARGGAAGSLGFPTGAAVCEGSTGCRQQFDGGWLLWTAAAGARVGDPAIDAAHNASSGVLGTRTAGSFVRYAYNGGGFAEGFANGAVFYKPSVGAAFAVSGAVRDAYFATGGAAGRYGWPTSAMTCANGTCAQSFEGGTISATG
ncbi:hypothetical protein LG299_15375 [Microbacterium lacus]|uniref:hypothetical protein n=1 Tax=Microbacterium lacus TaxID=415217 RepID=UPI00384A666D